MFFVPIYILILALTIVIDYFAGIWIENAAKKNKKRLLSLSIVANVGVLALFKYYNFINQNLSDLLGIFHYSNPVPFLSILLPIGLSFHTFQAMSYTIEVYRGNQKAERHFGIYALYVMFYPQLVAGPIERPQNVLHQFHEKKYFNYDKAISGFKLMAWGMFKKVVIADRLSLFVNQVYDQPQNYEGISLVVATVFFTFQIYCDFSGYSDIAIGSARVMGFELMTNFKRPYLAQNIVEFWSRWHISLSTWFRDYLYIPLGGNRVSVNRRYVNLFIVFMISGLWHGANWTFVFWGFLHSIYLIGGIYFKPLQDKFSAKSGLSKFPFLEKSFHTFWVFLLASFAWIFFRTQSMQDGFYIAQHMFHNLFQTIQDALTNKNFGRLKYLYLEQSQNDFFLAVLSIGFLLRIDTLDEKKSIWLRLQESNKVLKWFFYFFLIYFTLFFGVFEKAQFIYFQF
jgi:alginate O-acetyltransferase complex protein AlgI